MKLNKNFCGISNQSLYSRIIKLNILNSETNNYMKEIVDLPIEFLAQAINLGNQLQSSLIIISDKYGNNSPRLDANKTVERLLYNTEYSIQNKILDCYVPDWTTPIYITATNKIIQKLQIRTIQQHEISIANLIKRIESNINKYFGIDMFLQKNISNSIRDVFLNLDIQKNEAWIFWGTTTASQTNYIYNLLYGFKDETSIICLGMGFEVEVYASKSVVLGFTTSSSQRLTVDCNIVMIKEPILNFKNLKIGSLSQLI
ncbi:TPA: hypothetical protein RMI67_006513 [Bacillus cereus]|nr:hypothetical protein [Bacillus cereus]